MSIEIILKLVDRIQRSERRIVMLEQKMQRVNSAVSVAKGNSAAQLAVPGTPAMMIGAIFVARIGAEAESSIQEELGKYLYWATIQMPKSGLVEWQNHCDVTSQVLVTTLPDSTGMSQQLNEDDLVYVRYEGVDKNSDTTRWTVLGSLGSPFKLAKFDGQRWANAQSVGKLYTGHYINLDTLAADSEKPVQWKFYNDAGVDTLIDPQTFVLLFPAPKGDTDDWKETEIYGPKMWAILSPWAALG